MGSGNRLSIPLLAGSSQGAALIQGGLPTPHSHRSQSTSGPRPPPLSASEPSSPGRTLYLVTIQTSLSSLSTTCQCLVRPLCALPPSLSSHLLSTWKVLLPFPLSLPLPETVNLSLCSPHPASCPGSCSQWTSWTLWGSLVSGPHLPATMINMLRVVMAKMGNMQDSMAKVTGEMKTRRDNQRKQ